MPGGASQAAVSAPVRGSSSRTWLPFQASNLPARSECGGAPVIAGRSKRPDGETAVPQSGRRAALWRGDAYDPLHYELSAPAGAAIPHPADAQTSRDRGGSFCLWETR